MARKRRKLTHSPPTVSSFFSGAGLMDIGLEAAGLNILNAFEFDEAACATYSHNFRHKAVVCDITKKLVSVGADVDIMVFTYPCTKYSSGANMHRARNGDDLYLHAVRHIAVARPECFVIENVPGMRGFPLAMEAISSMADYHIEVFCPIKSEMWLPQRRDRLIVLASKTKFKWTPPVIDTRVLLKDIVEVSPEVSKTNSVYYRLDGKYRDSPIISNPATNDIAPTCVAHYSKDKSTRLVVDENFPRGVRPYSVREYARLQGVPDSFTFPVSEANAYKQIGNGVSVPVGAWIGRNLIKYFEYIKP